MTEHLLHHCERYAFLEQERCRGVATVMKPDVPRDGPGVELVIAARARASRSLVPRLVESAAMAATTMLVTNNDARSRQCSAQNAVERYIPTHHLAVSAGEHELAGGAERGLEVRPQRGDEWKQASFPILRPWSIPGTPDTDFSGAQVDVRLSQSAELALAHAGVERGCVEWSEPRRNFSQDVRHFLEAEHVVRPPDDLAPRHRGNGIRTSLPGSARHARVAEHLRGARAKLVQRLGGKQLLLGSEQCVEARGRHLRGGKLPEWSKVLLEKTAQRWRSQILSLVLPPVVEQRAEGEPR